MKQSLVLIIAVFCAAHVYAGEEKSPLELETSSPWSIILTTNFWSNYSTEGVIYADVAVFQSDLWIQHESGIFFDLWGSTGIFEEAAFDDEIDVGIGWTGSIGDIDVTVGIWYFWIEDIVPVAGDIVRPSLKLSRTFQFDDNFSVTPFILYNHYHTLGVIDGGNAVSTGVGLGKSLTDSLSGYLNGFIVIDDGYFGSPPDNRFVGEAGINLKLNEKTSIGFGLRAVTGSDVYPDDVSWGPVLTHSF